MALVGMARAKENITRKSFGFGQGGKCVVYQREGTTLVKVLLEFLFHFMEACKYIHWWSVRLGLRWFQFVRQHIGRQHVHTGKIVNMLDGGSKYVVRFSK